MLVHLSSINDPSILKYNTWSYKTNIRNTLHNPNSHIYKMISINLKFSTNKSLTKTCTGKRPIAWLTPELLTWNDSVAIKISEKEQLVDFSILLADPRDWR